MLARNMKSCVLETKHQIVMGALDICYVRPTNQFMSMRFTFKYLFDDRGTLIVYRSIKILIIIVVVRACMFLLRLQTSVPFLEGRR